MKNKSLRMLFVAVATLTVCGGVTFGVKTFMNNNDTSTIQESGSKEVMIDEVAASGPEATDQNQQMVDKSMFDYDLNSIYWIDNKGEKYKSDDITVELAKASIQNDKLQIEYTVRLDKVNDLEISDGNGSWEPGEEYDNYINNYLDYYKKLGYDKYFEFSYDENLYEIDVKRNFAKMFFEGQLIEPRFSESHLASTIIGDYVDVIETYDLGDIDMAKSSQFVLALNELEIPLEFETMETYFENTKDILLAKTEDNVSVMCQTSYDDYMGKYYVDLTTVNEGNIGNETTEVEGFDVHMLADGQPVIISTNPAYYVDDGKGASHFLADINDLDDYDEIKLFVDAIYLSGTPNDKIDIRIADAGYGEIEVSEWGKLLDGQIKFESIELLDFKTACDRWGDDTDVYIMSGETVGEGYYGDCLEIRYSEDSKLQLTGFTDIYLNGIVDFNAVNGAQADYYDYYEELYAEEPVVHDKNNKICNVYLCKDKEDVDTITLGNPRYIYLPDKEMMFKVK